MHKATISDRYLPFVDGMRAVSIICVVAHHVRLPGFSGGFVGVDVFFVISGFLIINFIRERLFAGDFSFSGFFARRVLRILPPLTLVLVASAALAPFVLVTPDQMARFRSELLASGLMVANHHFYQQGGYFDPSADTKPLLHLWTLSVEEQFYLVVPFLAWAILRLAHRRGWTRERAWMASTVAFFILSLVLCILLTREIRNPAFYLMPLRGWEFIAGGAVPLLLPLLGGVSRRTSTILAGLGMLAIAVSVAGFDATTPFPSYRAALPVLGAVLVLVAGLHDPGNVVARALGLGPMVGLGLVSYAWYLWHWPLLVFGRIRNFGDADVTLDLAAVTAGLLLAIITYVLLERPIRFGRRRLLQRIGAPAAVMSGTAASVATAFVLASAVAHQAVSLRHNAPDGAFPNPVYSFVKGSDCLLDWRTRLPAGCAAQAAGILLGDSFAQAMFTTMKPHADAAGSRFVTVILAGCLPLPSLPAGPPHNCATETGRALDALRRLQQPLTYVLINANWANYIWTGRPPHSASMLARMGAPPPDDPDPAGSVVARFARLFQDLRTLGVERAVIVGPQPVFPRSGPECVAQSRLQGVRPDRCSASRSRIDQMRATQLAVLRRVADAPAIRLIDPADALCDANICSQFDGGRLHYVDHAHLSEDGAARVYRTYERDFQWLFTGR